MRLVKFSFLLLIGTLTVGIAVIEADYYDDPSWSSDDDSFTMSVAVGDFDDDGTLDIVAANYNHPYTTGNVTSGNAGSYSQSDFGDYLVIYFNGSTSSTTISSDKFCFDKVEVADLDNDGDLDIVAGCVNGKGHDGDNYFYLNNGSGSFSERTLTGDHLQDTHDIVLGDINNDGWMDILEVGVYGSICMWISEGDPGGASYVFDNIPVTASSITFYLPDTVFGLTDATGKVVELGDIDQDGYLDLFTDLTGWPVIYLNQGSGEYFDSQHACSSSFKENISCASFGWLYNEEDRYLALAIGSKENQEDSRIYTQRGNNVYIYDSGGDSLVHLMITAPTETEGDNYQLVTDIQWACIDTNDDIQDIITGGYPALDKEGGSLIWSDGFEQLFEMYDPDIDITSTFDPDTVEPDWISPNSDLTTSIVLGDIDGDDLVIDTVNYDISGASDKLVYLDYFPIHELIAAEYYDDQSNGWSAIADSDFCYHPRNGWISFDHSLNHDSARIRYKYSTALDLIVGNDGYNRVYEYLATASSVSDPSPFSVTSTPDTYKHNSGSTTYTESQMDQNGAIGYALQAPVSNLESALVNAPDMNLYLCWIWWQDIEWIRGHYFWDFVDKMVSKAIDNDLTTILLADGSGQMKWTYPVTNNDTLKHPIDEKYGAFFARNLVNRYRDGGVIDTYCSYYKPWGGTVGIENYAFEGEPWEWGTMAYHLDIPAYRDKLKYNYGMVKAIDTDFTVISPNFRNEVLSGSNISSIDIPYLDSLYAGPDSALKHYTDIINQQFHCWDDTTGILWHDPASHNTLEGILDSLNALMTRYNDYNKLLMSIEWGIMEDENPDEKLASWTLTQSAELFQNKRFKWSCGGIDAFNDNVITKSLNQQAKLLKSYRFKEKNTYFDIDVTAAPDDTLTTITEYVFEDPEDDEKYVHQIRTDSLSIENTLKIQLETDTLDIDGDHAAIDYLNDNHFERQVNEDDAVGYGWVTFLEAEVDTTPLYLSEIVDGTNYDLDIIIEAERWRMISTNLEPSSYLMSNIFADFESDSLEIHRYDGNYGVRDNNTWYWTPSAFNWNQYEGYLVWSEDADTLSISDNEWWGVNDTFDIDPEDFSDTTRNNYFIAYTPCWDMPCSTAFYQLLHWTNRDCVVFYYATSVNQGLTYLPEHSGQSDYYMMRQGESYFMRFKADSVLHGFYFTTDDTSVLDSYNGKPGANENDINSTVEMHYQPHWPSQDLYPIVLEDIEINGITPTEDDEIGVFMWDSILVGAKNFTSEDGFVITAWEDDIMTEEVDGYIEGETMSFKFWDISAGLEYDLELSYTISNALQTDLPYSTNPIFGNRNYAKLSFGATLKGDLLPDKYALHQNYPNPFNPTTTIRFDLPEFSMVKLEVFNILGQRVAVLLDGNYPAGYKSVRWNANEISSGLYFLKMEAKGLDSGKKFRQIKKMMLIK